MNQYLPEGSTKGLPVSSPSDSRLALSQLRQAIREIDRQIAEIRTEERLFQRYHFGSDIHLIKLTALHAERLDVLTRIAAYQRRTRVAATATDPAASRRSSNQSAASWFLLPAALAAVVWGAVFPKRRRARVSTAATAALAAVVQ